MMFVVNAFGVERELFRHSVGVLACVLGAATLMGNDAFDRMSNDDSYRRIAVMRELLEKSKFTLTNTVAATDDSVGTAGARRRSGG